LKQPLRRAGAVSGCARGREALTAGRSGVYAGCMSGSVERSGRGVRIVAAMVVTLGVAAGYFGMKAAGLFGQIGPTPTRLLIGADLFVVGLLWFRVFRR